LKKALMVRRPMPARWNRAVFYDGGIFHSGDIDWTAAEGYLAGTRPMTSK
jgi:hypothetical protein